MITNSRRRKLDKYKPIRIIKKYGVISQTARVIHGKHSKSGSLSSRDPLSFFVNNFRYRRDTDTIPKQGRQHFLRQIRIIKKIKIISSIAKVISSLAQQTALFRQSARRSGLSTLPGGPN